MLSKKMYWIKDLYWNLVKLYKIKSSVQSLFHARYSLRNLDMKYLNSYSSSSLFLQNLLKPQYLSVCSNTSILYFSTSSLAHKKQTRKNKILKISKYQMENEIINEDEIFDDEELKSIVRENIGNLEGCSSIAVIQPYVKWGRNKKTYTLPKLLLDEACALIKSLPSMTIAYKASIGVKDIKQTFIFGTGATADLIQHTRNSSAKAVFISVESISSVYKSDLEELFGMRVFDRFDVVLHIFKFYAQSMEARLQIALAEVPLMRGNISGEKEKLLIHSYEAKLNKAITKLSYQRSRVRENRKKQFISSVAIIGYTNCGKTTLIGCLTGDKKIEGENRLFATLDVTAHMGPMPCGLEVLYLDSVGFIQDLSTNLIASFQATLQDALNADVIVHVRDISHPDVVAQTKSVYETLDDLEVPASTPVILVNNKSDLLEETFQLYSHLDRENPIYKEGIYVSAITGNGLQDMLTKVQSELLRVTGRKMYCMKLPIGSSKISWLKDHLNVANEEVMEDNLNTRLYVLMNEAEKASFIRAFKV